MMKKYRTGEMLNYLGVSRDTLRFYEERGLLNPGKNKENNYRGYDLYDIYKIMIIDFYKRRGMTIHQIQEILNQSDVQDMQTLLESKRIELEGMIYDTQCMLKRIEETQIFSKNLESNLNTFSVRPLPFYKIKGELSDFIAVEEYEKVKDIMNSSNADMLSQIIRYICFDKKGVISTKMLIAETVDAKKENSGYLNFPRCLYTVAQEIQPRDMQEDLIEKMYRVSTEYAAEHGFELLGEAFAMIRLITYKENKSTAYIEIFIPFG